jgi:hypothetical protein
LSGRPRLRYNEGVLKLRYETGVVALVQFLVMVLLNFVGAIVSAIGTCYDAGDTYECVSGVGIELVYVVLLAAWFGFVAVLAYGAQDRRDHKLAFLLMGAEGIILMISLFNAKHYPNILGLITSLIDAAFAVLVIWLALRLLRAKGGRITGAATRSRRRPAGRASK